MTEIFHQIFGTGKELTALQMSARAFVFFFITLLYLRIAGLRTFGKKSSIDMVIVIVLGSVIARGIAGASGFGATLAASAVLVIVHRFISWLSFKNKAIERMIKGEKLLLFTEGLFLEENMERAGISKRDFFESLRISTNDDDPGKVTTAYMETNGELSFILKEKK